MYKNLQIAHLSYVWQIPEYTTELSLREIFYVNIKRMHDSTLLDSTFEKEHICKHDASRK